MNAKTLRLMLIISLVVCFLAIPRQVKAQERTRMIVSPSASAPESNLNFTVDIKIEIPYPMNSYQVYISWDPALVQISHGSRFATAFGNKTLVEGPFLKNGTQFTTFFTGTLNSAAGTLAIFDSQQTGHPFETAVAGNGTLVTIIFEAKGTGQCPLHLYNAQIVYGIDTTYPVSTFDGYFNNQLYTITTPDMNTHDIFIESNSTVSDFGFNLAGNRTFFNVTGLTGSTGYFNITIPKDLLDADPSVPPYDWIVLFDGGSVTEYTKTTNGTHTFIYFTYAQTQHNVQIIGNKGWVVPEYAIPWLAFVAMAIFTALLLAKSPRRLRKPEAAR